MLLMVLNAKNANFVSHPQISYVRVVGSVYILIALLGLRRILRFQLVPNGDVETVGNGDNMEYLLNHTILIWRTIFAAFSHERQIFRCTNFYFGWPLVESVTHDAVGKAHIGKKK